MFSILISVILAGLAALAALGLYLYFFQSQLIYYPSHAIMATPQDAGLSFETIHLQTEDNIKLEGWFVPAPNSIGTILFLHGNTGNISDRLESIEIFHGLGYDTFIIDYRGYGRSEGKPTERGTYLDAKAAWHYLAQQRGITPQTIVIFGRSLGGAIAAWLAARHTPCALVIESTFTSAPDMAHRLYPLLPTRLLNGFRYNTLEYVKAVHCPILVVHSQQDELTPFEHGRTLYEAANAPKELLSISGSHNDGFVTSGQRYIKGLEGFLNQHRKGA